MGALFVEASDRSLEQLIIEGDNLMYAAKNVGKRTAASTGLCALALAGFVTILTEALPAGLLPQIGVSLRVSETMVASRSIAACGDPA
ncbi:MULTISPECIES: hypothetical protein [unclassified Rhizobium]|uniref:hypothetical protein n=1 Tax=unclassified Rhizobium TaxID=2613769 RepID=UPI000BE9474D|nr:MULTISPECIES: hypothetical protein [unclassified Rhizobium]MDF0663602.1 hypothetical protein [Rhizobium sp. BC49]PDS79862.1 hypothetical protein CO654_31530 [Rhizobium sp. L18]